jgi:methionyl-tRNA synthetase
MKENFAFTNLNNTTFVTTAIDYPNALPHIGTAFEKIGADVYARFRRFQGRDVIFSMGNDENTVKVLKAAQTDGYSSYKEMTIKHYADEMAERFQEVWRELDISFDEFIQTSSPHHHDGVKQFLQVVNAAGYIEKRLYKALYCEGCEEFKTPNSLDHLKRCPNHPNTPLVLREEENWFFLQSKFRQRVHDTIWSAYGSPFPTANICVEPETRRNEVLKYLQGDLEDISISRKNEGWGIPIPWDESQVTYVWFDALLNYLTVIGFGKDWERFNKYWPAEVHFIGKDITRFHCGLFPAMIMAYNEGHKKLGLPDEQRIKAFPQTVFAHGFINSKGAKIAKTGEAIRPMDLVKQFGSDGYRYYFLSKFDYGSDGEYSLEHMKEVYNADLANSLGNLLSRTVGLTMQHLDGKLPAGPPPIPEFSWWDEKCLLMHESLMERCQYRSILEAVWKSVFAANQYVENEKPWETGKTDKAKCAVTLRALAAHLRIIAILLHPFMPKAAAKIYSTFQWKDEWAGLNWNRLTELAKNNFDGLENGIAVNPDVLDAQRKLPPLFPRVK